MKNYLKLLFLIVLTGLVSCEPELFDFDDTLLIGKWVSGTEYYRYDIDGKGVSWDTSEDVTEQEGQPFFWTLVKSDLTLIHVVIMGGNVEKYYTITELTATSLKYRDDFGKTYSFSKVNN